MVLSEDLLECICTVNGFKQTIMMIRYSIVWFPSNHTAVHQI
jgi:hypothetical protein